MDAGAAATAAAHRRVKRAMGLLRAAAPLLAPESAGDHQVVGEARVETNAELRELVDLLQDRRRRFGPLDVVILARRDVDVDRHPG